MDSAVEGLVILSEALKRSHVTADGLMHHSIISIIESIKFDAGYRRKILVSLC